MDLYRLKEDFGQQVSFRSLSWLCLASQVRVFLSDPACCSPHFKHNTHLLQLAMTRPNNIPNRVAWQDWYNRSFAVTITNTYNALYSEIGDVLQTPQCRNYINQRRKQYIDHMHGTNAAQPRPPIQKIAYQCISQHRSPNRIERIRRKIVRWQLHNYVATHPPPNTSIRHLTPNWQAHRIACMLEALRSTTTPRVRAAMFSTIWNRWNTHRRWQRRNAPTNTCLFGCGANTEDSIEHYCGCNTIKEAMRRQLNLDPFYFANVHTFILCNDHINDVETLTTIAVLVYATYTTTNSLRHNLQGRQKDPTFAYDMLIQNVRNAVSNHSTSTYILDNRWNPHFQRTPIKQDFVSLYNSTR